MNEKFFALSNRPQSHEAFYEAKTRMLKVVKFTVRLEWMTYLRSDEQKIHYYFSEKNRVLLRQQRQRLWQRRPIFSVIRKNRKNRLSKNSWNCPFGFKSQYCSVQKREILSHLTKTQCSQIFQIRNFVENYGLTSFFQISSE